MTQKILDGNGLRPDEYATHMLDTLWRHFCSQHCRNWGVKQFYSRSRQNTLVTNQGLVLTISYHVMESEVQDVIDSYFGFCHQVRFSEVRRVKNDETCILLRTVPFLYDWTNTLAPLHGALDLLDKRLSKADKQDDFTQRDGTRTWRHPRFLGESYFVS